MEVRAASNISTMRAAHACMSMWISDLAILSGFELKVE